MKSRTWSQVLLLTPLWLAFWLGWWRVLKNWPAADLFRSVELLGGIAAAYALALAWWILHNIHLYRAKPRRSAPRAVVADFSHDVLGRPVRCDGREVFSAQQIIVEIAGGEKIYRSAPSLRGSFDPQDQPDYVALHSGR
jgi:hypothetical protein